MAFNPADYMADEDFEMQEDYPVYHERQLTDSNLCAVHCINNLLQYPYYDVQSFFHIVEVLREKEKEMYMTDADPTSFNANMLTEYVSPDGNYSIEVIKAALHSDLLNLEMYRWPRNDNNNNNDNSNDEPHLQTGFICHFKNHWIALRKIYNQWYDLNSLSGLPEILSIPTKMSEFYLSAHLATLKEQGYSIFVVTGKWPPIHEYKELKQYETSQINNKGKKVETCKVYLSKNLKSRDKTYPKNVLNDVSRSLNGQSVGMNGGMNDDYMLQQAMAASLNDGNKGFGNVHDDNDPQLLQALAASLNNQNNGNKTNNNNGNNNSNNNDNNNNNNNNEEIEMTDEESMKKAMLMSMQCEFEEKVPEEPKKDDKNRIEIQLKLINGKQIIRGFINDNTLQDVENFVKSQDSADVLEKSIYFLIPPRSKFEDLSMKLSQLGGKRIRLIVKISENNTQNDNNDDQKENSEKDKSEKNKSENVSKNDTTTTNSSEFVMVDKQ